MTRARSFCEALAALAATDPNLPLVADAPGRQAWAGLPGRELDADGLDNAANGLVARFEAAGLMPGDPVVISMPASSEAMACLCAVSRAGFAGLLVPLHLPFDDAHRIVRDSAALAVVTVTRVGDLDPAQMWVRVAAQEFSVSHVFAFGPSPPPGVTPLDGVFLARDDDALDGDRAGAAGQGLFAVEHHGGAVGIVPLDEGRILSDAAALARQAGVGASDIVVSTLQPVSHASLATGLGLALVAGARLVGIGVPSSAALRGALAGDARSHLVLPADAEGLAATSDLSGGASTLLVGEPAARPVERLMPGPAETGPLVVEVVPTGTGVTATRRAVPRRAPYRAA
jgi:non-ribosomal peptide synthetase component F